MLRHVRQPDLTIAHAEQLKCIANIHRRCNDLRDPSEVQLNAGGKDLVRYLRQWRLPERDVAKMEAFLAPLDGTRIACLTMGAMGSCAVALGTKLSVLAVISSGRATSQASDSEPVKRKAANLEQVFEEVQKVPGIHAEDVAAFKKLFVPKLPGGRCSFTIHDFHTLRETDLTDAGIPLGISRLTLKYLAVFKKTAGEESVGDKNTRLNWPLMFE